ncbi:MAG TPA: non-canonical purine NTP pyrophosphatase [Acidobacteriaceae bacterium]|nr:non-canonical purine NTP pyrophosphatase [Acidobacteriaceae bacterium]
MTRIYAATGNPGKLRDFAVAAGVSPGIVIEPLPGLNELAAPPEDEPDFEGNARLKAVYYSRFAPGEWVIADDSGLQVDALGGEPGVRSARYAADAGFRADGATTDEINNLLLVRNMAEVPEGQRQGRYRCVIAAVRDGELLFTGDGAVDGEILTAPRGTGGFGYDPLFYLPSLGKTMAEIDLEIKHRISHRGNALRAVLGKMGVR